jgi:hypothetical protein
MQLAHLVEGNRENADEVFILAPGGNWQFTSNITSNTTSCIFARKAIRIGHPIIARETERACYGDGAELGLSDSGLAKRRRNDSSATSHAKYHPHVLRSGNSGTPLQYAVM